MIRSILVASVSAAALALSVPAFAQDAAAQEDTFEPMEFPGWGVNIEDIDKSASPGDDFFAYVNGKWLAATSIPPQFSYAGVVRNLRDGADYNVRDIVQNLEQTDASPGSPERNVGKLYAAFMDTDAIDRAGMAPVTPYLQQIYGAEYAEKLAALFAEPGMPSPIGLQVYEDANDPERNTLYGFISGLGLPDRDYYLVDNERNREIQKGYKQLLAFVLGKAGYQDPEAAANSVYEFEHAIAVRDWDKAVARNPVLTNHPMAPAEAAALSDAFPLMVTLRAAGVGDSKSINIQEVLPKPDQQAAMGVTDEDMKKLGGGFPAVLNLLGETPIATLQAWAAAQFILDHASVMPSDIDAADFAFYGKTLSGTEEQLTRWRRGVALVNGAMGEAVGKAYVDKYFPPQSKVAMIELVNNLLKSQEIGIKNLDWMTDATKVAALEKLKKFNVKIGYPNKFETYDGLSLSADSPLANSMAVAAWHWQDDRKEIDQPVDPDKWHMNAQTVNAYYNPISNEIVFPAAYLQPPMFNPNADAAVNYGAVGSTIGHEIGHGFDDEGSQFDGDGLLRNWWTDKDRKAFEQRTGKLVEQYNAICPYEGACHNGRLTLGENIGDLGGLAMAYRAYRLSLNGSEAPVIDGLTGDQRFFIAYAQAERWKLREAFARRLLQSDPHSLAEARINGTLRNFDPWYAAFNVTPKNKLYLPPEERVRIW